MSELKERVIKLGLELGNELFYEMSNECDGSYVGAGSSIEFTCDDTLYKLEIDGFWESSNWYSYSIEGIDFQESGTKYL